jgi:ATP-dependent DNA helicase RecG
MIKPETPIELIPRIGSAYSQKLKKLGLQTAQDLLFYFPHRYEDLSKITSIKKAKEKEKLCLKGKITSISNHPTFHHRFIITEALFQDKSGTLKVVWFNQPYLAEELLEQEVYLAGRLKRGKHGLHLSSPVQEKVKKGEKPLHLARLVPVYPETKGLTSRWLRYIIHSLLPSRGKINDPLPSTVKEENKLLDLPTALAAIHFPTSQKEAEKARFRFAFEELFLLQLQAGKRKLENKAQAAFPISLNISKTKKLIESLNFNLTDSQKKAAWQILQDLSKPQPMSRLLEGDVGSGKTIVAAIALLNTIQAGYQAALMAPTSVLAQQHFQTFIQLFKGFRLKIGLLTNEVSYLNSRSLPVKELLEKLAQGKIDFLIGTHSLIQDRVKFPQLAFVIIDEQHRFGVRQRAQLKENSFQQKIPHFLSLSATPIPRTLALTLYGDLDLSRLTEIPANRLPVETKIIPPSERSAAYQFIRQEIKKGHQAFIVCPRIESSDEEVKTAKEEYKKLSQDIFPELKVGLLHGRLKPKEKGKILRDFQTGRLQILVSTSVVEVGLDIPQATIMMIEGAERFGLAQLHQLRGRVGRSSAPSFCLLFTESATATARRRLQALVKCHDGFALAEKDLKLRGPGDIYGLSQWGIPDLAMANLNNLPLIEKTRRAAMNLLAENPQLKGLPLLRQKLKNLGKTTHLE